MADTINLTSSRIVSGGEIWKSIYDYGSVSEKKEGLIVSYMTLRDSRASKTRESAKRKIASRKDTGVLHSRGFPCGNSSPPIESPTTSRHNISSGVSPSRLFSYLLSQSVSVVRSRQQISLKRNLDQGGEGGRFSPV